MRVGDCVEEGANGASDLILLAEVSRPLYLHLLLLFFRLLFGDGLGRWWRIGMTVGPEEGFGIVDVFSDSEMILYLSKRIVGLRLVEIVLLLALADHESQAAREVGVSASDVEFDVFVVFVLAGQFDHVHVVLDQSSSLDVDFQREDFLDGLERLARGKDNWVSLCHQWLLFRLGLSLRLCANGNISLFGRIGVLIEQAHQFFILSLLDILGLDG